MQPQLLGGDTFDAETPAPDTLRHALRAMADASDITWVLLPGNHDATWYSGTPEADGFKHAAACCALLVTLDGTAQVRGIETGSLGWQVVTLDLLPGDDPLA